MTRKLARKLSSESVKYRKMRAPKGKRNTAARKRRFAVALVRAEKNPIISPKPENNWEAWQTFNPGVILLNDKVHFIYRAIGQDGISRLGYAVSSDGFSIDERLPYPVYEHRVTRREFNIFSYFSGGSWGGAEDPRIVRVDGEDTLHMTYTACDNGLRVALTSINLQDFSGKKWRWKPPVLISAPGEVHKNWVIFPEKINDKYAILHSVSPEISVAYRESLEFQEGEYIQSYHNGESRGRNCWESWLRGAGAPPIKTHLGWLLFYHALDKIELGKYKVGAMILDTDDPTKVLWCARDPILEPGEDYENSGFKAGVVYVSGAVVKNGELLVYYGASDSYVGVAHAPLEEFLEALTKESAPKLKVKTLKKK